MVNLSDILNLFITSKFLPDIQLKIKNAFFLLNEFGDSFFEDRYVSILSSEETIDNTDKQDIFINILKKDLLSIVNEHFIELDSDYDITLIELVDIVSFLHLIQRLENYEDVSYRLNSEDLNKNIIIDLIVMYTSLSKVRLLEIIKTVDYKLIEGLKMYIKENIVQEDIDMTYKKNLDRFFNFIGTEECIGKNLYDKGYLNLTLGELTNLMTTDIPTYIDGKIESNPAKACLDILSLLFLTKDNYNIPLYKLKTNTRVFTDKSTNVTKIVSIIEKMLVDFNTFCEGENLKEKANVQ